MARTPKLIALSILIAFGGSPQTPTKPWPQEPTGFKSVPFGSSRKEARSILHFKMGDCPRFENTLCTLKIDAVGFTLTAYLKFSDKQFVEAVGTFPSENYSDVRDMFVSMYGPPQDTKESEVQNGLGATFKQEILHWNGSRAFVMLGRYGSTVTGGMFAVGLASVRDAEVAAREAAKKNVLK